jgi:hypothetical protein
LKVPNNHRSEKVELPSETSWHEKVELLRRIYQLQRSQDEPGARAPIAEVTPAEKECNLAPWKGESAIVSKLREAEQKCLSPDIRRL